MKHANSQATHAPGFSLQPHSTLSTHEKSEEIQKH